MTKKKKNIYISLQDATRYCDYSQEYLSLRARQGKLKSKKNGRNWVTTKEWLKKYINQVEKYKEKIKSKTDKNKQVRKLSSTSIGKRKRPKTVLASSNKEKKINEFLSQPRVQETSSASLSTSSGQGSGQAIIKERENLIPDNLPTRESQLKEKHIDELFERFVQVESSEKSFSGDFSRNKKTSFYKGVLFAVVFISLLFVGAALGNMFLEKIHNYAYILGESDSVIIKEKAESINKDFSMDSKGLSNVSETISSTIDTFAYISQYTIDVFEDYFEWLGKEITKMSIHIYSSTANLIEKLNNKQ